MEFSRAGVAVEVMTASTPHDERQLTIRRFEQGITKIIINVGVLVAGFDSDVRCIIFARPTKSEMRWIQTLGRGLRAALAKIYCLIFDHSGTVNKLGYPDDIEYDYLPSSSDGMEDAQQRVVKADEPENCRKSAVNAITSNLPEFTSARNVVLNHWPGKTLKPINPVD
jgi:superfamily II DNA or RNA helicase